MTNDIDILARTLWGEARGEGPVGMTAVACTIMNRVNIDLHNDGKPDWWGEGYVGVCQKPWQYSCWNSNDPNRAKLLAVTTADPQFKQALVIATKVVAGEQCDTTGGATHYFAPKVVGTPKWAQGRTPTVTINNQVFYRVLD